MEKEQKTLEDKVLDKIAGGAGKTNGWVCARCGAVVTTAKGKNGKSYCIPCYTEEFGDPMA